MRSNLLTFIALFLIIQVNQIKGQASWQKLANFPAGEVFQELTINGEDVPIGLTLDRKLFHGSTDGDTWTSFASYPAHYNINLVEGSNEDDRVFVGTSCCGVAMTDNYGLNWTNEPFTVSDQGFGESVTAVAANYSGSGLLVSTVRVGGGVVRPLYYSSDNGETFFEMYLFESIISNLFYFSDELIFIPRQDGGLWLMDELGETPSLTVPTSTEVIDMTYDGTTILYLGRTEEGYFIYSSTDGANWTQELAFDPGITPKGITYFVAENVPIVLTDEGTLSLIDGELNSLDLRPVTCGITTEDHLIVGGESLMGIFNYEFFTAVPFDQTNIQGANAPYDGYGVYQDQIFMSALFHNFIPSIKIENLTEESYQVNPDASDVSGVRALKNGVDGSLWSAGQDFISEYNPSTNTWDNIYNEDNSPVTNPALGFFPIDLAVGSDGAVAIKQVGSFSLFVASPEGVWSELVPGEIVDGLTVGDVNSFTFNNEAIYASGLTMNSEGEFIIGLLRSADFGASWEAVETGDLQLLNIFADNEDGVFGTLDNEVYMLDEENSEWVNMNLGVTPTSSGHSVKLYFDYNNNLYALVSPLNSVLEDAGLYKYFQGTDNWEFYGLPEIAEGGVDFIRLTDIGFTPENIPLGFTENWSYIDDEFSGIYSYSDEPLDIAELENDKKFIVYPNPSQGDVYFEEFTGQVRVMSLTGQLVQEQNVSGASSLHLNQNLESGMYLIHFQSNTGINQTQKLFLDQNY